ncbi:MAG: TonB family protein [Acidobacteriota bacterium]|nr:TonB family protein [Acidobacteriota bacterium]
MKTALILDADLSFAYWLEQGLDEAGYLAFPAKNAADAAALPDEFKNGLDLLIVNPSVPGTAKLIETLRQWNEHIKVVALMGDELPPKTARARADLYCRRPDPQQTYKRHRWIRRIEELLPVTLFQKGLSVTGEGLLPFERLGSWLLEHARGRISQPRQIAPEQFDRDVSDNPVAERKVEAARARIIQTRQVTPEQFDRDVSDNPVAERKVETARARIIQPIPSAPERSHAVVSETRETPRKEDWKQWERRILGGRFRLRRHLGGSDDTGVFLTRYGDGSEWAAIRLVRAESDNSEILLSRWKRASGLSHPGLIRLFEAGTCQAHETKLLYVVMEYGEENLAETLRERSLTPAEAREMLEPVADTLQYLHEFGLVHGRLKPSQILITGNQVKVASDWIHAAGEPGWGFQAPSVYEPPESVSGMCSPAGDVWALGVTLVEALTQTQPLQRRPKAKRVFLPATLPVAFREIAHGCLQGNPRRRETAGQIAHRLRQTSPAGEPITLLMPKTGAARWTYAIPAIALLLGLSATLLGPGLPRLPVPASWFEHLPRPQAWVERAEKLVGVNLTGQPPPPAAPVPLVVTRHVVEKILPEISPTARKTIRGTVRVSVRTQVDPSGHVASAELETHGPSPYFADQALEAARHWTFDPLPALPGSSPKPSEEWRLRFEYTTTATSAAAERVGP